MGGTAVFLIVLAIVAAVFSRLGLTTGHHALGLPEGSIRAFIALTLILLFLLLTNVIYGTLQGASTRQPYEMLTQSQIAEVGGAVLRQVPAGDREGEAVYSGFVEVGPPEEAVGIANQLITTLGTLVVAIAAFYFGASSVSSAQAAGARQEPALSIVHPDSPTELARVNGDFVPLVIHLSRSPEDLLVRAEVDGDEAVSLRAAAHGYFLYQPRQPTSNTVTLRFAAAERPDLISELIVILTGAGESPTDASRGQP